MDETLDILYGEGEVKTTTKRRARRRCNFCGNAAHYRYTFLLPHARSNPASTGYRKDDISRCEDESQYACEYKGCQEQAEKLDDYNLCSIFPASERFAHLFLTWADIDTTEETTELYQDCLTMALRLYGEDFDTFAPETQKVMQKWIPKVEDILNNGEKQLHLPV